MSRRIDTPDRTRPVRPTAPPLPATSTDAPFATQAHGRPAGGSTAADEVHLPMKVEPDHRRGGASSDARPGHRQPLRSGERTMNPLGRLAVALALLILSAAPLAGQDPADEAWRTGDVATAERLYRERLAATPGDLVALHRLALAAAWAERYEESLLLFDRLLGLEPEHVEARIDRARTLAWRGDTAGALEALREVLSREPANPEALQAFAQVASWRGAHGLALETYGRILDLQPGDRQASIGQARAFALATRLDESIAAYRAILEARPDDREALLGLAQAYAWARRHDEARAVYGRLLAHRPDDRDARLGIAQSQAWEGNLVAAEHAYRALLAEDPADVAALTGLGQTLRWQGRPGRAIQVLGDAVRIAPTDADLRTQVAATRADLALRAAATRAYEADSDGNRIGTLSLAGSGRPDVRLDVRAEAYFRSAADAVPDRAALSAWGGAVGVGWEIDPGWLLSAGTGLSASDAGAGSSPVWGARLAARSPARNAAVATLAYGRSAFDPTRALIERRVVTEELSLSGSYRLGPGWTANAATGLARFQGEETNRRWSALAAAEHRLSAPLRVAATLRGFGFEKQLREGYFAPDLYILGELTGRWSHERPRWTLSLEGAPGLQQVGSDGAVAGSVRLASRVGYTLAPGREVGFSAAYSTAGLQQLGETVGTYRYTALSLSGSWTF
jgi:tetratricopeptide (TPR) repeat protein